MPTVLVCIYQCLLPALFQLPVLHKATGQKRQIDRLTEVTIVLLLCLLFLGHAGTLTL